MSGWRKRQIERLTMNEYLVQNIYGVWVIDGFALWLSTHALGEIDDPNPICNTLPIDLFNLKDPQIWKDIK